MNAIRHHLKRLRVEAGVNQSDIAEKLGVSASRLSRMETGEIEVDLDDAREILEFIDSPDARSYLEYLSLDPEERRGIPFDHPDWRLLSRAARLISEVGEVKLDPVLKAVFLRRLDLYEEEIIDLMSYLEDRQHTLAVIGSIGIGKTTAICHIADLVVATEDSPEKKPVLEVGGGATTVCEVVVRAAPNYGILIDPMPDEMIRKEVQDFSDFLLALQGRKDEGTPVCSTDDLSISREIERAIRNMAGLNKKRRKGEDGRRIVEDPALDIARESNDARELAIEILTRMNLPRRDRRNLWCPESNHDDALKWLQRNFADINNGRNPECCLPQRIEIALPHERVRGIFCDGSDLGSTSGLELCIVDTKGIDQTAERADLEQHFYDPRTVTVLCSGFNDAPEASTQTLLKRAVEAKAPEVEQKSMILVLPRANEALAVKDESGDVPESDEEGYELKGEQVDLRLNGLGLPGLACKFFNAHKDDNHGVKKSILEKVVALREAHKERLSSLMDRVRNLIENKEDAQRAEVMSAAASQVRTWITRNQKLPEIHSHVEDDLLSAIGRSHASTIRATLRRRGEWRNLDYSHHLSYGARAVLAKKTESAIAEFDTLLRNLKETEDFSLALDFLDQLSDLMNSELQQMLAEMQVAGPAAFDDSLADAQNELWLPCLEQWGKGPGFRDRVKRANEKWFEVKQEIDSFLHGLCEEKWQSALDKIDELLEASRDAHGETPSGEEIDVRAYLEAIGKEWNTEALDAADFRETLSEVLSTLTEREEKVLRLRFGLGDGFPRSHAEIASVFNISERTVGVVESKALRKLRHPTRARELKRGLGMTL